MLMMVTVQRKKLKLWGGKEKENHSDQVNLLNRLLFDEILTRLPAKSLLRFKSVAKNWYSTITKPSITRLQHNRAQSGQVNLPNHLLFDEILTRLPAKSLLRFKSVARNWYSTITKPSFTRLQHNRAQSRPDGGCLAISTFVLKRRGFFTNYLFTCGYQGGPASLLLSTNDYNVSKSTHGLILLFFKNECKVSRTVFIYNPTIKQLVRLPPISNYIDNDTCHNNSNSFWVNYYLGYDPLTGIYKVLAMCTLCDNNKVESYYLFIFILGMESWTWRKLDDNIAFFPRPSKIVSSSACCVNGALHWLVSTTDDQENTTKDGYEYILSFDVGTEKFRKLLPLSGRLSFMDMLIEVGVDKLGLSCYKSGVLEVWVLEDYDKREWVKVKVETPLAWNNIEDVEYRLCEVHCKLMVPPRRRKKNEVLWVYWYDKSGKEWSMLEVTGVQPGEEDMVYLEVSNNVETLFSATAGLEPNIVDGLKSAGLGSSIYIH